MVEPRPAVATVGFVDDYCHHYGDLFSDVRNFESLKFLVLGMISEIKRKSLPAIASSVGLPNAQSLHHFLQHASWQVERLRERRLELIKQLIGTRSMILCIDETGEAKSGKNHGLCRQTIYWQLGQNCQWYCVS